MKYLIIVVLSIISVSMGYLFKNKVYQRVTQLEDIIIVIDKIKTHLNYCNVSVEEILLIMTQEKKFVFAFTENIIKEYSTLPFHQLWMREIDNYKNKLSINNEELGLLIDFGKNLGTTDLNGQIGICQMFKSLFEECLNNAKEAKNKYAQTYLKLGYIGAALIVTLMI